MNWRRWNAVLHRDIGYLATGLILVYAISGVAINHIADWNPNYRREQRIHQVAPFDRTLSQEELTRQARERLKLGEPKGSHQQNEDTLRLFYEKRTYLVDLPTGKVLEEGDQPRPVLYAMNRLHVNAPKRLWTWIADLFALSLAFLSVSGLFILKGRNGITGRGAWLTSLGVALPALYWVWWMAR